jgi:isochorismate hydrolase
MSHIVGGNAFRNILKLAQHTQRALLPIAATAHHQSTSPAEVSVVHGREVSSSPAA